MNLGDQHVAAATDGLDDARALAVVTQLLAQPADLYVDSALHRQALAATGRIGDGVAVEHHAGLLQKHAEQHGIAAGEVQQAAILVGQLVAQGVQGPLGKAQPAARLLLFLRLAEFGAAQQRLDAGLQFAWAERLGDVVVGTEFETDHPIRLVGGRRQHDDGDLGVATDLLAEGKAVVAGHHDVQNDQIRAVLGELLAHLVALRCGQYLEACPGQVLVEQLADLLVVIDDQQLFAHWHMYVHPPIFLCRLNLSGEQKASKPPI